MNYVIQKGDSLQSIAQKFLGDTSKWTELAIINKLEYPFISEITIENTLKPGDLLQISYHKEQNSEIPSDNTYGDLVLSSDKINLSYSNPGEFLFTSRGDLKTINSYDSLTQDLIHRLLTPKGTLLYHPEYGSDFLEIVGHKKDEFWKQKAIIELEKTFLSDNRVLSIVRTELINMTLGVQIKVYMNSSLGVIYIDRRVG